MSNNIWFNSGDKVMRVAGNTPGAPLAKYNHETPKYGQVYCVSQCFKAIDGKTQITLVGFPPGYSSQTGREVGWPASAFRKVEEIRLCIAAVNKITETEKKEVPTV